MWQWAVLPYWTLSEIDRLPERKNLSNSSINTYKLLESNELTNCQKWIISQNCEITKKILQFKTMKHTFFSPAGQGTVFKDVLLGYNSNDKKNNYKNLAS